MLGLAVDPNYEKNNWIYLFYSAPGDESIQHVSRFDLTDDKLDLASEKILLKIPTLRKCCHSGGALEFGPKGNLFITLGDNTNPFESSGYAPIDERPERALWDAQKSAANTNDLRGKILRIKVNEDGSYDIPEGNLFAKGTEKTRPEIYTMGHRNPYRISVDSKRGYVYWGDVGPDARVDSLETRGPRGYDEMNQARKAGNFGWPLFIGDNKPYVAYNYETGESGTAFDPEKPINNSRNNTGLTELPPAQPAYVFYPYVDTSEFPQVATGGRNAMAGPTYYSDMYADGGGLPGYYDGKVIIYDWMRGWMMAVHLFEDGSFNKMEPFASDIDVNNLIDMEMGPDGRMYLLEYGSGWFSQNDDSALSYVEFNGGNRPPVIDNMIVDKTSGKLPLSVTAKVEARDREEDPVSYIWNLGNGETKETTEPEISYTYDTAGEYKISVDVKDTNGEAAKSEMVAVVAGNSRPEVDIAITSGNSSFYVPGQPVGYEVSVTDAEGGEIDPSNIFVSVDYLEGMDKVAMSLGHQQVSAAVTGKALTQAMDCKTCHKEAEASIGPTYLDVAKKYKDDENAMAYLQKKIKEGGTGVWGEVMMPAHPNVTSDESRQIALYIQSLVGGGNMKPSLPPKGSVKAEAKTAGNLMVLTASYTDVGAEGASPLTGSKSVALSSNTVSFNNGMKTEGMQAISFGGMDLFLLGADKGWLELENIDLSGVKSVIAAAGWQEAPKAAYDFEVRAGAPDGEVIGKGRMDAAPAGSPGGAAVIPLTGKVDGKTNLYIAYAVEEGKEPAQIALMNVTFN